MTGWLFDTLLWTGVLLAVVLVLRRPVARHFGPQAAYALWLLPALRLVTPAITLPAGMRPTSKPLLEPLAENGTVMPIASPAFDTTALPLAEEPAALATAGGMAADIAALLLAAWLAGAAVFLFIRFRAYFEMRRELLDEARQVGTCDGGWIGPIRLIETEATNAPLAFGVLDRVIALPPRFLAMAERPMRDLALAHELAHHKGGDLIANFAVQPLFALHWFNPLGWVGWRAMRRDQEAACDARVVGTADAELRADYAQTIACFAAGPRVALAAPMACPVLGDKSIIHRLRSLTMTDISNRRRWAGRSLLLAGALALPLTASITYAESTQDVPAAPRAPASSTPPASPTAAEAPEAPSFAVQEEDFDTVFEEGEDGKVVRRKVIVENDSEGDHGKEVHVIKTVDENGKVHVRRHVKKIKIKGEDGREYSPEEFEKVIEKKMERHGKHMEEMGERIEKRMEERFGKDHKAMIAKADCDVSKGKLSKVKTEDGAFAIAICAEGIEKEAMASALTSLKRVRGTLAIERNLTDTQRAEALRAIDAEIARLEKEG
ncbi:M56 family metallopeptidase [Qipengyuania sp. CAU 1752]